jgi:hypothetical protein
MFTNPIAKSKLPGMIAAAAMSLAAASPVHATTLDKLFGGKSILVGNLVFSNFSAPVFSGAGPSNIDVQGVVVTDPATGAQKAGLQFSVVPQAFVMSPNGGPHEIAFWIDYSVTDTTGQLATISQSTNYSVAGQAGALFWTTASPSQAVTDGSLADPRLSIVEICNWFGSVCPTQSDVAKPGMFTFSEDVQLASASLYPAATVFVQHEVDLQISNRKGVPGGTTTFQSLQVMFAE